MRVFYLTWRRGIGPPFTERNSTLCSKTNFARYFSENSFIFAVLKSTDLPYTPPLRELGFSPANNG
jgi:hypothetical protein